MKIYSVGDKVWLARCEHEEKEVLCPVCFGKYKVTVILGNGDHVEVDCDFCGKGFSGPRGVVTDYHYRSNPELVTITAVTRRQSEKGEEVEYHSGCRFLEVANLFDTKEEADKRSEELRAEYEESFMRRLEANKADNHRGYTWAVGYHMREARRHREDAERHEQRARVCKERAGKKS
jgi:uncharacterized Zn-finger protein